MPLQFFAISWLTLVSFQEPSVDPKGLVRELTRKLNDPKAESRKEAAGDIARVASALRTASMQLALKVATDPDPEVRREAALAIAEIGPSASVSLTHLMKGLDDKDERVRSAVIRAIGGIAPFSKGAIPKLKIMFQDKNPTVRREIIGALRNFKSDGREAVPILIAAIHDPDPGIPMKQLSVSHLAILALADMGEDAYAALDALTKIKESGDRETRTLALSTLAKIMPKDLRLLPMLIDDLKSIENKSLRAGAAHAIGFLGPKAKEAVPTLIKALKAEDVDDPKLDMRIKLAVMYALGEIGTAAKESVPAIRYVLNNTTDELLIATGRDAIQKIDGR